MKIYNKWPVFGVILALVLSATVVQSAQKALEAAIKREDVARVAALLATDAGCRAVQDPQGLCSPLNEAIKKRNRAVIDLILAQNPDVHYGGDYERHTALHVAAEVGDVRTARVCLARGADVDAVSVGSGTPLAMAALGGHVVMACLLLEHGADVNLKTEFVAEAPSYAAVVMINSKKHQHIIRLFAAWGADFMPDLIENMREKLGQRFGQFYEKVSRICGMREQLIQKALVNRHGVPQECARLIMQFGKQQFASPNIQAR